MIYREALTNLDNLSVLVVFHSFVSGRRRVKCDLLNSFVFFLAFLYSASSPLPLNMPFRHTYAAASCLSRRHLIPKIIMTTDPCTDIAHPEDPSWTSSSKDIIRIVFFDFCSVSKTKWPALLLAVMQLDPPSGLDS